MADTGMNVLDPFGIMTFWHSIAAAPQNALAPQNLAQSILPNWSLISVNENNSSAPDTERRILAQNSYGRQIGRMMDAVEALIEQRSAEQVASASPDQKQAYKEFDLLKADVDEVKEAASERRIRQLVNDLKRLRKEHPESFQTLLRAVKG